MATDISAHGQETSVRLKTKPSRQLLARLLDQTKVKEIVLTKGIEATIPSQVRAALEKSDIKLTLLPARAGRPAKYEGKKREQALALIERGKIAADVSKALGVPTTAIYYWRWAQKRKENGMRKKGAPAMLDST